MAYVDTTEGGSSWQLTIRRKHYERECVAQDTLENATSEH